MHCKKISCLLGYSHEDGSPGQGDGGYATNDIREPAKDQGPNKEPEHPEGAGKGTEVSVVTYDVPLHGDSLGEVGLVIGPHGARLLLVPGHCVAPESRDVYLHHLRFRRLLEDLTLKEKTRISRAASNGSNQRKSERCLLVFQHNC